MGNYQFTITSYGEVRLRGHIHPAYVANYWAKGDKERVIEWLKRRIPEVQEFIPEFPNDYSVDESPHPFLLDRGDAICEITQAIQMIRDNEKLTDAFSNPLRSDL